ncbi:MAG: hypothetical protein WBP58_07370 [Chitinophagaceae bacterium]
MKCFFIALLILAIGFSCSPDAKSNKAAADKSVFRSTDGGLTWQDISKGLPENMPKEGISGDSIFANEKGLFLTLGGELYHHSVNSSDAYWTKESLNGKNNSMLPGRSGTMAFTYWNANLTTTNGTNVWSPIFQNVRGPRIRSSFESTTGTLFIGTDRGIFKTIDTGKTWKFVYEGELVGHLAESDGVLLSTTMGKIIRSTDNGENWSPVSSEDSVAFDIKPIKGGFAAITAASASAPRRLSTSFDGGKTWQSVHSTLQDKEMIASIWKSWNKRPLLKTFQTAITQVDENFICIHPQGIFKSLDKGKTWELLVPSVAGKVFNLYGSGGLIYAVSSKPGC